MEDYKLVREHRKRAGLTQGELATRAKLKGNTVYVIEAGKRGASRKALQRIAVALRDAGQPFPAEVEAFLGLEPVAANGGGGTET